MPTIRTGRFAKSVTPLEEENDIDFNSPAKPKGTNRSTQHIETIDEAIEYINNPKNNVTENQSETILSQYSKQEIEEAIDRLATRNNKAQINKEAIAMSNSEFLKPNVRSIDDVAPADSIKSTITKASDVEGQLLIIRNVEFRDSEYMGKPTKNAWCDAELVDEGEDIRLVVSGFKVIQQLKKVDEENSFPIQGVLHMIKDKGSANRHWELLGE